MIGSEDARMMQESGQFPSFGHSVCKTCENDRNYFNCAMSLRYNWPNSAPPLVHRTDCKYLQMLYNWMIKEKPSRVCKVLSLCKK